MRKAMGRWAVAAVAVPLAAAGARKLSQVVETRRGPTSRTSKLLRGGADLLQGSGRSAKPSLFGRR